MGFRIRRSRTRARLLIPRPRPFRRGRQAPVSRHAVRDRAVRCGRDRPQLSPGRASRLGRAPRGIPLIPLNPTYSRQIPPQKKSPIPWAGQIGREGEDGGRRGNAGGDDGGFSLSSLGRRGPGRGGEARRLRPGAGCERESVFCIRFLKGLKSPARSTAYSVPGAPVWQARALRPAGPSLRLKRIYRRSGGLPIVPAAVSGCSSLSAAMMSAIRVFTSLSDASRGL